MAKRQWAYRPSDKEHEALLRMMARYPEYTSIAQVIREGVLRLIHDGDRRNLFTRLDNSIDEFQTLKEKFVDLLIDMSEEDKR